MSAATEQFRYELSNTIRSIAMMFPEAAEGTSCVNRAFSAGNKNFLFLGEKDDECNMRLRLGDSIPEVEALGAQAPGRYGVGKFGWTMMRFAPDDPPARDDLERWITESFRILVPKKVVALLDG